jgi:hypothetical protein
VRNQINNFRLKFDFSKFALYNEDRKDVDLQILSRGRNSLMAIISGTACSADTSFILYV